MNIDNRVSRPFNKRLRAHSEFAVIYIQEDGQDITQKRAKLWKNSINSKIKGVRVLSKIKMGITHVVTVDETLVGLDPGLKVSPLPNFVPPAWISEVIKNIEVIKNTENAQLDKLIAELTTKFKYDIDEEDNYESSSESNKSNQINPTNHETSPLVTFKDTKNKNTGNSTRQMKGHDDFIIDNNGNNNGGNSGHDVGDGEVMSRRSESICISNGKEFDMEKCARGDNDNSASSYSNFTDTKRKHYAFSKYKSLENPMQDEKTKLVVELFLEMSKYCALDTSPNAEFRSLAYKYQASFYKKHGITDSNLMHFGDKCAKKICQISDTGKFEKLESVKNQPRNVAKLELIKVHGIGPSSADKLFDIYKVSSIDDLRKLAADEKTRHVLSQATQIGLKYYDDIQQKIPRSEVEAITETVNASVGTALGLQEAPSGVICTAVGSYRRGKLLTGDVDIIIKFPEYLSHQDTDYNSPYKLLVQIITYLQKNHILKETLSLSEEVVKDSTNYKRFLKATYMGMIKLPNYQCNRRIDVKIYHVLQPR